MTKIKGYKAFDKDMTCRGMKFKVGRTYTSLEPPVLCQSGYHFCVSLCDVYNYYPRHEDTLICEVEAVGMTITDGDKSVTQTIKITRQLTDKERLVAWINRTNSGNHNSGIRNSGDYNSGNHNSGNYNRGSYNSGDYNSGYRNSGNRNSGNRNSGDYNSGYRNSGNHNSGNHNSGDFNSGNRNSGNHNSGNRNSGLFNTTEPHVRLFNRQSTLTRQDLRIQAVLSIGPVLTEFVSLSQMTDKEKSDNPTAQTTNGYLRVIPYKEAWLNFWVSATPETRKKFVSLPFFDKAIFLDITGIDVDKTYVK